ncbi:MAG: DUF1559 domain-containing protein, partial [Planctomycetes bacterium]|nr:DUF1559 domain-containing protein [Planctomycetota bacterium]
MNTWGRGRWTVLDVAVATVVVGVATLLIVVGVSRGRERVRRNHCQDNLRQLGLALQSYHQACGMFPPAAVREDSRTAIELNNVTSGGVNYSLRRTY